MKSTDIIFTIIIIIVFLGLYLSNILAIGMKKVKDNWPLYRCSPAVMPFASIFGHDVGDNFMQCIQTTQSSYMEYLMLPLNHIISLVGGVATKIVKDTENIRGFIGKLRDKILSIVKNIFGVFSNIIISFQRIIIAMKDMIKKLVGIFSTLMFFDEHLVVDFSNLLLLFLVLYFFVFLTLYYIWTKKKGAATINYMLNNYARVLSRKLYFAENT